VYVVERIHAAVKESLVTSISTTLAGVLAERLKGDVIDPDDPRYDDARRVWNGMIDRRPALIARCRSAGDVAAAVTFAREHGLPIAVRGGGHNVAGSAVADGGLVVDLGEMRAVDVDPVARHARVEGGATWADVDSATQPHGLVVPGGVVSQTGVAGLTLNGGVSWHRRKHGMTIDNLVGAEVVTADGRIVRASATENPDLLWALRGGGGNFGVVTAFEFGLHELGPEVAFLYAAYPVEYATEVFRRYRDLVADAPDELTVDFGIEYFASVPELPPELHGVMYAGVFGMYAGPVEEGMRAFQPFRELAPPLLDLTGPYPFVGVQTMLDAKFPDGVRRYWKALYLDALTDEAIDVIVERSLAMPSEQTLVFLRHLGGAVGRVPAGATGFGDRRAQFMLSIDSSWLDAAGDETNVGWTRAFWSQLEPWSGGRTYFNFPGAHEEGDAALRASYGANYERLVDIKTAWDPDNVFSTGQNIRPRR
jgi:FAD/FMN-containing dehydrogenase